MMVLAVVLVLLLAAFLLAGFFAVRMACGRVPTPDLSDPDALEQSGLTRNHPGIPEAQRWLKTQPVQDLFVMSYDNKKLHGRFIPCEDARGTLLLFHGWHSLGDIDFAPTMAYLHSQGFHLLLVDQRAHGRSEGRFLTFGCKERMDVLSWVSYLSAALGEHHPMYLCGLSMGAATVMMASAMEFPANVRGVIADCGYSSPYAIVRQVISQHVRHGAGLLTALSGFFTLLYCGFGLKDWSAVEALAETRLPVLLLHGQGDNFVPCAMSEQCRDACKSEVTLVKFPGADHCMSYPSDPARCRQVLEQFLNNHLEEERNK